MYDRFGMSHVDVGKKCGVVEEVKRQTLKWFGHMERMEEGKMTRRVYMSEIEGGNVRGRPPVEWRDRVQEYVRERGEGSLRNLEQARRVCQDRERWKLFCRGLSVGSPAHLWDSKTRLSVCEQGRGGQRVVQAEEWEGDRLGFLKGLASWAVRANQGGRVADGRRVEKGDGIQRRREGIQVEGRKKQDKRDHWASSRREGKRQQRRTKNRKGKRNAENYLHHFCFKCLPVPQKVPQEI